MYGCPDDLTVWLCHTCHGRVHGQQNRMNLSDMAKAMWQRPEFRENAVRMAKEIWKHPEFRNKAAETAKAIWEQGRFREKLLRALRSKYPRP